MEKSDVVSKMKASDAYVPGKTVKLDFGGSEGVILLDGKNNTVSEEDQAADTTIKISWADFQAMSRKELDPMTAFMQGKLKVEGDMSVAMQLQGVLAKVGS